VRLRPGGAHGAARWDLPTGQGEPALESPPAHGTPRVRTDSPGGGTSEPPWSQRGARGAPFPESGPWRGAHILVPSAALSGAPLQLPVPGTPRVRAASPGRLSELANHRPFVSRGSTPGQEEGAPAAEAP